MDDPELDATRSDFGGLGRSDLILADPPDDRGPRITVIETLERLERMREKARRKRRRQALKRVGRRRRRNKIAR
jgi:hypothetical protein